MTETGSTQLVDFGFVRTTCPYCGCGCEILLETCNGRLIDTLPSKTHPMNKGKLCIKGWNAHEFVHNPARLTAPLLKRNGEFTEVSWDEALGFLTERLEGIRDRHGGNNIAFLSSARCTNEENYLFQKLARVGFGANNIDHCARLCHASTVAGLATVFGSGAMTNSIAEIEDADCIFITGSNTGVTHPLVAYRIVRAKAKGAKVIVADPRRIPLADIADIYVRQRLGSDVALINGIIHVILEKGLQDEAFINERTEGFEALREHVKAYPPEKVAEITGVSPSDIVLIAETYAKADRASVVYAMGITQHSHGVDNVQSLANLAMVTGNIGRPSTGVNPLRGQNNVQGACDMGALPNVYPGYQAVTDPAVKKKFEDAWNAKLSDTVGPTIVEMMRGLSEGSLRGMVVLGENPMGSDPDTNHVRHALQSAELLAVIDIFLTETAKLAHVALPAACFAEKDGTFTSTERCVLRVRKAVEAPGRARPDWRIISELGNRLGIPMQYAHPSEIFDEMARLTPSYAGLDYARLERGPIAWPCPSSDHPGTPILHKERFTRGKGLFRTIDYRPPAELPDEEFPFQLTTGRCFPHYHTGTMTRNSASLHKEMPEGFAELNPLDAEALGIKDHETARFVSRRGDVLCKALITETTAPGNVFMSFHFVEANANVLTNPALDPICKIPEFKVCAVRVEKVR
jgi:formate dehydrogenase alpha subunit